MVHGYSSESTKRELSNEYQYDRVQVVFESIRVLVLLTKVASELEGLKSNMGLCVIIPCGIPRNRLMVTSLYSICPM